MLVTWVMSPHFVELERWCTGRTWLQTYKESPLECHVYEQDSPAQGKEKHLAHEFQNNIGIKWGWICGAVKGKPILSWLTI